jgi:hypothetical protein
MPRLMLDTTYVFTQLSGTRPRCSNGWNALALRTLQFQASLLRSYGQE